MSALCELKTDFVKLAERFAGMWVALHPETDEVVASGSSIEEAIEAAAAAGVTDPIITKVVDDYGAYVTWIA